MWIRPARCNSRMCGASMAGDKVDTATDRIATGACFDGTGWGAMPLNTAMCMCAKAGAGSTTHSWRDRTPQTVCKKKAPQMPRKKKVARMPRKKKAARMPRGTTQMARTRWMHV